MADQTVIEKSPTERTGPQKRRTFAIISHPDAGKTTLTEHLLFLGGAIHLAGQVKARGERRRARSDWMKIEQQRGISVTTAVMTFEYRGITFNLLDTPGHEDFSEDTYRTLTAADSAIMVIDAAKGIEAQTRKLFEVCRLRDIPIFTFVNKMDREGRDPFELIDEVSEQLQLETVPMMWPCGTGNQFRGCLDLERNEFLPFGLSDDQEEQLPVGLNRIAEFASEDQQEKLMEEAELVKEACPTFDQEMFLEGHMTPVYFGSALKAFGVKTLLDKIADAAPPPRVQPASPRAVSPSEDKVSGFVFKVQANMDPNHRDRVAFLRICSGKFKRGMRLRQSSTGKMVSVHNPILFFASNRELADEAFPGDIIGIPNHGTLRVGDTLTEGEDLVFTGIPNFAPEILQRVRLEDPMKMKHLRRALESLAEEGVTQVFKPMLGANWIVGVVGSLQLDVLKERIKQEYGIDVLLESAPFDCARWVTAADQKDVERFLDRNKDGAAEDRDGSAVFLAKSAWELNYVGEKFPALTFHKTRERTQIATA